MKLKVEYVSAGSITPYKGNAKLHPPAQIEQIKASIKEFGFNDPIAVWHGEIVEGHGRLMAAEELGIDKLPIIRLDDLTDEQRRGYILAHNKLTMNSGFDPELLAIELDNLPELDMEQFGFDISLSMPGESASDNATEDDYDEENAETKCKLGDIWQLGDHRLICGDSTDDNVIKMLIGEKKADMVFTDPPYGMNLNTDYSDMVNNLSFAKEKRLSRGKKYDKGKVDEFHPEMVNAAFSIDANEMFLWGADYYAELLPDKNNGSWIVWDKRANGNDDIEQDYSSDKMYGSCFELCWSKKSINVI